VSLLRNATSGAIIATRIDRASTFMERTFGLLGRSHVRPDEGLWFDRCSAIHTLGMRTSIDIIFMDRDNAVLKLCPNVRTWRWAVVCRTARGVIELGCGALREADIMPGDRLELVINTVVDRVTL
jgi:uncharacterized membrane protein (UPF0127 family)